MLVSNGKQTRNIADRQLPEYQRMGYKVVEPKKPEPKTPVKKGK